MLPHIDREVIENSYGMQIIPPASEKDHFLFAESYLHADSHRRINKTVDAFSIEQCFSEMILESPLQREIILVVIDCANVAYNFGNNVFKAKGIEIAIKYLTALGIEFKAFIPISYFRSKPRDKSKGNATMQTEDTEIIERLVAEGLISVVPAGIVYILLIIYNS